MKILERLIKYAKFDTQSTEKSSSIPSTSKQMILGKELVQELKDLGISNAYMDGYGYVYGEIEGDPKYYSIGLIAHMDTSEMASGYNVKPRVIENYDGKDIILNENVVTKVDTFKFLPNLKGKTLLVTDGNTLLGADDKAGIAIIMEVLEEVLTNNIPHGNIKVCFTPDEEIGQGTRKFNFDFFKVDFAYTVDGGDYEAIEYENFNAARADITIKGIPVHPGDAKDKMVNAITLAYEFHSMLDPNAVPEKTEGREGFNMIKDIEGSSSKVTVSYIIRNHDANLLNKQKQDFIDIQDKLNNKYGYKAIDAKVTDSYQNMKEMFIGHSEPIELVRKAMTNIGLNYKELAIRGGTDGARLTYNGILCPNLGTGGYNYHGVNELWCKQEGEKVAEYIIELLKIALK